MLDDPQQHVVGSSFSRKRKAQSDHPTASEEETIFCESSNTSLTNSSSSRSLSTNCDGLSAFSNENDSSTECIGGTVKDYPGSSMTVQDLILSPIDPFLLPENPEMSPFSPWVGQLDGQDWLKDTN